MNRRTFVNTMAGSFLAAPLATNAQQAGRVWRIGFLRVGMVPIPPTFWSAMRGFGWIEGRNVTVEHRYAERAEQLSALAVELVKLEVDLILTFGTPPTWAAKRATPSLPIVFRVDRDPVESGLVFSMAQPGGNLTGFQYGIFDGKLLEVLKAAVPAAMRIACPARSADPDPQTMRTARALGVQMQFIRVQGPKDLANLCATARKGGADAVLFANIAWHFSPDLVEIAAEAMKYRLPAIHQFRDFVEAGGLLCYGPVEDQHWPRAAAQVDKIFRGTKPADLPVELSTKFELLVNLKTARALGLTLPQSLLLRADEVIQ